MPYFLGGDVVIAVQFVNTTTGLPVDPSSVVATVTDPTGAVTTPATSSSTVGTWTAVCQGVGTAGLWKVRWVGSGSFNAVYEDEFIVRTQQLLQVVDLTSVKRQLKIVNDTSTDDELVGYIEAATEQIRDIIGPVFAETHVEYFSGGSTELSVDWKPLQSVTSIVEYMGNNAYQITEQPLGAQTSNYGFTADYTTGELTRRTFGGGAVQWASGYKNIKVTYVSGLTSIPFSVRLAALELIQHWWNSMSRQQHSRGRGQLDESPSMAFAVPWSVEEKLAPWRRPPGVS